MDIKCEEHIYDSNNFSFLTMGDTGGIPRYPYTSHSGRVLAKTLSNWALKSSPKFVILLGDNFYDKGVKSLSDSRFQSSFEDLYSNDTLNIPWYVIAGNHDHLGSVQAQISYTSLSRRWKYPHFYYQLSFKIKHPLHEEKPLNFQIVAVDTVILCGKKYYLDLENQNKIETNTIIRVDWDDQDTDKHWDWLKSILSKSSADFILVIGHYPIYSIGHHGPDKCLIKKLRPLLIKHRVNAYISGHDHDQQHLSENYVTQPINNLTIPNEMHYFVFGSGSRIDPKSPHKNSIPPNMFKYFQADVDKFGGFGSFGLDSNASLKINFVDGLGKVSYAVSLKMRNNLYSPHL
ncbi:unnamed protein product [Gordionus sp. m RMFG-2023]